MAPLITIPAGESIPARPAVPKSNRPVDLAQIPSVPFARVDEHVYAAIRGCSVKTIQRERQEGTGCSYRKINGKTVRYRLGDIIEFLDSQPGGGGALPGEHEKRGSGRPNKTRPHGVRNDHRRSEWQEQTETCLNLPGRS